MRLKDFLKGKLTKKEYDVFPTSFDIIGDVAIFNEIPKELSKKEKLIAASLLKLNTNIKVVCKKIRNYSGKYRTLKLKIISGETRKETTYIENGCRFLLDVEKVYFSPRLGNERMRISDLVKRNENVLVMFSGCGPYTVQIAKKASRVTAIEANPVAHKYALINLKLNKISNAEVIKGDVKNIIPKLRQKYDRIIMPLPKESMKYLKEALSVSKKGTIIHLYSFAKEDEFKDSENSIISICKKHGKRCEILRIVRAGEYSPRTYRICVDFKVQ